jgi:membrane fusion protein, heavy metal efflux system
LKKDMYVVATVKAGAIKNAISVPDAAVLRDNENEPFVYAEFSSNQFGKRPVTLGESLQGQTEITGGLKPGDRVIGDGSIFLQFANSLQR